MAYPTDGLLVWEINDSGNANDNNGGAYYNDGTGGAVDKSQGAAIVRNDLVLGAGGTTVTSAGTPFAASDAKNIINITGGAGFTVNRYLIVSVAAGVATLSSSAGTGGSTGGTSRLGGPMRTPGLCAAAAAAISSESGVVWITGTHTMTSDTSNIAAGVAVFPQGYQIYGYHAVRGDRVLSSTMLPYLNRTTTTNTNLISFTGGVVGTWFSGIRGVRMQSAGGRVWSSLHIRAVSDCWIQGVDFYSDAGEFSNCRFQLTGGFSMVGRENGISNSVIFCNSGDITGTLTNSLLVVATNLVGGDSYQPPDINNCTIVATGAIFTSPTFRMGTFTRCLFYSTNAGVSVVGNALYPSTIRMLDCAYNGAPTNVVNKSGVLYTGDPFVNRAGGDYSLTPAIQALFTGMVDMPGYPTTQTRNYVGAIVPANTGGGGGGGEDMPTVVGTPALTLTGAGYDLVLTGAWSGLLASEVSDIRLLVQATATAAPAADAADWFPLRSLKDPNITVPAGYRLYAMGPKGAVLRRTKDT